jgi:hypothetical protein
MTTSSIYGYLQLFASVADAKAEQCGFRNTIDSTAAEGDA